MAFSKLTIGDLLIDTKASWLLKFDENLWHEMLVKLTKFYLKSMIPKFLPSILRIILADSYAVLLTLVQSIPEHLYLYCHK